MLRYYESMGLISPNRSDTHNNYREYSANDLQQVAKIKTLQALGFSLAQIKEIQQLKQPEALQPYLETQQTLLEKERQKIESQQALLDSIATVLAHDTRYLDYHVVLKDIPERHVMSLRRVISNYEEEGTLWQELYQEFLKQNVQFSQPPLGLSLYHDEAFEEEQIDLEIQSSIVGTYHNTADIIFKTTPKISVASATFHGSFDQMPLVMEAIGRWIVSQNYEMTGPMINISHVNPAQETDPDKWITEACIPISPKEEKTHGTTNQ